MPKRVNLVHGEPDAQAAIEPKIHALGLPTTIPRWRERITLETAPPSQPQSGWRLLLRNYILPGSSGFSG